MKKQTKTNLGAVFSTCLFKCDFMNIYKVFQLGKIRFVSVSLQILLESRLLSADFCKHSDLQSVPVHKKD